MCAALNTTFSVLLITIIALLLSRCLYRANLYACTAVCGWLRNIPWTKLTRGVFRSGILQAEQQTKKIRVQSYNFSVLELSGLNLQLTAMYKFYLKV
jgi:hypothetical protein